MLNRSRVGAFTGPGAEERAEKVGPYFKAMAGNDASRKFCVDRGIGLIRATGESSNTVGGFLAPQDFDAAIIAIREAAGAFRQGAETRPSGSDNQVRPRRVGGVTANFVREGAGIPESQLQFDAVETALKKLGIVSCVVAVQNSSRTALLISPNISRPNLATHWHWSRTM